MYNNVRTNSTYSSFTILQRESRISVSWFSKNIALPFRWTYLHTLYRTVRKLQALLRNAYNDPFGSAASHIRSRKWRRIGNT